MTLEQHSDFVVVDTSVLSYFTRGMPLEAAYRELLAGRTIGLSYFVRTELEGASWDPRQREQLDAVYEACIELAPSTATASWYSRGHAMRRQLRLVPDVGDTDLWIIAHAAEYGVPYMSHDRAACEIARSLGVEVLTALEG